MDHPGNNDLLYEPTPDWVDAAPFRAHTRTLITETGLPWRIIAAHAEVSPRALHTLLHGRRTGPVRRLHVSIARSLAATSVGSIEEAATLQTDAGPVRALLHALTRLGVTQAALSSYISADDWHHLSLTTTLSCSVATRARVTACYDLVTTVTTVSTRQPTGPCGGRPPAGGRNVDCGRHGARLDRRQETWPLSFSSPTPPRTR
jgi:hypothetical protein